MANGRYINIITIYGLVSSEEPNNIKYIGVTRRNPKYRLNSHIYKAKHFPEKTNKTKWINSVSEAAFHFNTNISSISKRINKNKRYKGLIFKTKN